MAEMSIICKTTELFVQGCFSVGPVCGRELRWASELHAAALGSDGRDELHMQNYTVSQGLFQSLMCVSCAK